MKITLHVGTEKTGSTSLQSTFIQNKEILIDKGWLFPETRYAYSHICLTACALEKLPNHPIRKLLRLENESKWEEFSKQYLNSLSCEIKKYSPDHLLISDEHINVHLRRIEQLRKLKSICEQFGEVETVIIYLRRQDKFRLSLFSEAVKVGNLTDFDIENPLPIFKEIPYRFNYLKILENLKIVFGENLLRPRLFEISAFKENNVVTDFAEVAGVPIILEQRSGLKSNISIDSQVIKSLARASLVINGKDSKLSEWIWPKILNFFEKNFIGAGPVLKKEFHLTFMDQFYEQNNLIKEKYFKNLRRNKLFAEKDLINTDDRIDTYPGCSLGWGGILIEYLKLKLMLDERKKDCL